MHASTETSPKELWEIAFSYLRESLSPITLNTWLIKIEPVHFEEDTLFLYFENDFQRGVASARYDTEITEAVTFALTRPAKVRYIDEAEKNALFSDKKEGATEPSDYEYTFDTFIVGNSNRFAHAASLSVASAPARSYNPLFIYGGSGLGKTHLLYAIMHQIKESFPSFNVVYLRGDDFANELIHSIQMGTNAEFRNKYRFADVLLVDDIQFIAGKEMTQQEFFHTFNSLYEAKKQIVLSSDRPPKEMSQLEDRLRTRFEWGLLADVQPPDYETRTAIINRKAALFGMTLSPEITALIANNVKTNIRQLEGTVKKLHAYQKLSGLSITVDIAQNAIRDIASDMETPVTPERVIDEVAAFFHVSTAEIRSKKRTQEIVNARQIAMYLVRSLMDLSLPKIGQSFGGRDHTTVMYSIEKVEEELKQNERLRKNIEDLKKNIESTQ